MKWDNDEIERKWEMIRSNSRGIPHCFFENLLPLTDNVIHADYIDNF